MRSSAVILLASIASAFAYQVTSPGEDENWTTTGPNVLTWVRVDTDPLNFTAVLTNQACVLIRALPSNSNNFRSEPAGRHATRCSGPQRTR
jgi:hypothetical protein